MRKLVWAALAALAAGCASTAELPAPVVRPELRPGLLLPPAQAETRLDVRTLVAEAGALREVAGATCRLDSDYFTGSFRTPAQLALPDLGQASPMLRVACTDGARQGTAAVRATLRGERGLGGWPAVGVSVGTGGDVGLSVGTLWGGRTWGAPRRAVYPDVRVELR